MIVYLEKRAKSYPQTARILEKLDSCEVIEISNYKNIFDKKISFKTEKCIILAVATWELVSDSPKGYSKYDHAYFFKNAINCTYDCKYCYLKWAFKNQFQVFFVNSDDIKLAIENKVKSVRESGYTWTIMFYASDQTDNIASDRLTWFISEFVPFFEKFDDVQMEIRTKSSDINNILDLWFVPINTEFAFSLNPESVISQIEIWTASLKDRLNAVNNLISAWFKVWIRFLPILPIKWSFPLYEELINKVINDIDLQKLSSIEAGSLLYTRDDYKSLLKKQPMERYLYMLWSEDGTYIRASIDFRIKMYRLFSSTFGQFHITLDELWKESF